MVTVVNLCALLDRGRSVGLSVASAVSKKASLPMFSARVNYELAFARKTMSIPAFMHMVIT